MIPQPLDDLARSQFGLVSRRQALELLGDSQLRRAVLDRHLLTVGRGVYRCAGAPATFRQRALAACLGYGPLVAVSHRSAGALWGYEPVSSGPEIEVSLPNGRSGRRPGIRAHRVVISAADVVHRYGIAVTSPARTLLDLAPMFQPAVLERCLDDALRAHHTTPTELREWLDRDDRHGRNGSAALRRLLDLRLSSAVGDSAGVDRVQRWILRAGLSAPAVGAAVVVAGRQRFLDLAYLPEKVAIEFNGWEFHQMRSRMDADHARTTELELAGWLVIVVTAAHGEVETVDRIGRALALRRSAGTFGWQGGASGMLAW